MKNKRGIMKSLGFNFEEYDLFTKEFTNFHLSVKVMNLKDKYKYKFRFYINKFYQTSYLPELKDKYLLKELNDESVYYQNTIELLKFYFRFDEKIELVKDEDIENKLFNVVSTIEKKCNKIVNDIHDNYEKEHVKFKSKLINFDSNNVKFDETIIKIIKPVVFLSEYENGRYNQRGHNGFKIPFKYIKEFSSYFDFDKLKTDVDNFNRYFSEKTNYVSFNDKLVEYLIKGNLEIDKSNIKLKINIKFSSYFDNKKQLELIAYDYLNKSIEKCNHIYCESEKINRFKDNDISTKLRKKTDSIQFAIMYDLNI